MSELHRSTEIEPAAVSAIELMEIQVRALYRHDVTDRLLSVNVPSRYLAPRVFVGRTVEGNVIRFRHDLADEIVKQLTALIETEPIPGNSSDLERTPSYLDSMRGLLAEDSPVEQIWHGPAWTFPGSIDVDDDRATLLDGSNAATLTRWFPWLIEELPDSWPCFAMLDGEDVVAVCRTVRNTSQAVEAGVETVETYRGRSFATTVVQAWALAVRAAELIPIYSTSWDNLASRGVARKLDLRLFGADLSIT